MTMKSNQHLSEHYNHHQLEVWNVLFIQTEVPLCLHLIKHAADWILTHNRNTNTFHSSLAVCQFYRLRFHSEAPEHITDV